MTHLENVLIVGFGSIGRRHARNLRALGIADLLVCDVDPKRRAAAHEMGAREYETLHAALDAQPAAVFVCTPPASHIEVAVAAAERGCHLFIEKPLADRLTRVAQLQEIAQRQQLVAMVACNLRFHPGLQLMKELVDQGVVGRLIGLRAEFGQYLPDWHPHEDYRQMYSVKSVLGGGVLLDAIHEFDYARWLMGEVESVACVAGKLSELEMDTEDVAAVLVRFARGGIGEIHLDYIQRAYSRTCQIIGQEGTLRWDFSAGETKWYTATARQWQRRRIPDGWDPNQMYIDEVRHFLACIEEGAVPLCDLTEGRRVLEIALAARRAAASGTTVAV